MSPCEDTSCWTDLGNDAIDDDGYDMLLDMNNYTAVEHPLDKALRTNDQALRCYYAEHGEKATKLNWGRLGSAARASYRRLPIVSGSGLPSGTFFIRTYEEKAQEIPEASARDHPMFAFQAF